MIVGAISIVVPMRDEREHVDRLVASIAAQDFRGEVEMLVADGGSTDGSPERLRDEAERLGVELTLLPNPQRWVSHGLNIAIARARGDLIVRMDCHAAYPSDYLSRLAAAAEETGAWNVGGVVAPEGRTPTERAVACAMDSPFGGIGWTRSAARNGRSEVDTVTFGAFRPEAFRHAGLFDESLLRNQDDELNLRLRRAGGRIVLDPAITVGYTPRGSYRKVLRQYYEYGLWKVPVMRKHRQVLSARSLAPLGLVASTSLLAVLAPVSRAARRALTAELGLYGSLAALAAAASVRRRGEPPTLLPRVAAAFPAFHLGYGAGTAAGLLRAALRRAGPPRPAPTARDEPSVGGEPSPVGEGPASAA
ncbi:MAG: glycosyltransferase family 2 protein [Solirubrobacteraceae bacterium]|nr:glycosyltransferase family 2 protein [Solirubrobacteraceae bacterium]